MNNDIFLHILDWLPPATLSSVCRLSHDANEIATPHLYRSVDLTVDDASPLAADTDIDPSETLVQKQLRFLDTLSGHPEYSSLVRQFAWTAGLLRDQDEAELREEVPYVTPELHLFESLARATNVSIKSSIPWVESNPMASNASASAECDALFPEARSVEVGGRMNDTLAKSMLQRKRRASLRSLRVDYLPEISEASGDEEC